MTPRGAAQRPKRCQTNREWLSVAWWRDFSTKSQLRFQAKTKDPTTSSSRFRIFIWCLKRELASSKFLRHRLISVNQKSSWISPILPRGSWTPSSTMNLTAKLRKPKHLRELWLHRRLSDFSRERLRISWIILRDLTPIFLCKDTTTWCLTKTPKVRTNLDKTNTRNLQIPQDLNEVWGIIVPVSLFWRYFINLTITNKIWRTF